MLVARLLRTNASCGSFGTNARNFGAFGIELLFGASHVVVGLVALMSGGDQRFFRFHLLRGGDGYARLAVRDFLGDTSELGLALFSQPFETSRLGFVLAQFALQGERTGIACAPTGDHATVIARAVRREVITVRIFA